MATKAYAQVYSLIRHDRTPQLLYDALAKFSKMGYDGVEGIGANSAGLALPDFKKYLADLNLEMISVMNLSTDEDLEYGAFMGAKYDVAGFRPKSLSRDVEDESDVVPDPVIYQLLDHGWETDRSVYEEAEELYRNK